MITYKKIDKTYFPQYDSISMLVNVKSYYKIEKQGAVFSAINEYAYYNEPEYRHETQFIWFLDL